jgi:hypothetical protein
VPQELLEPLVGGALAHLETAPPGLPEHPGNVLTLSHSSNGSSASSSTYLCYPSGQGWNVLMAAPLTNLQAGRVVRSFQSPIAQLVSPAGEAGFPSWGPAGTSMGPLAVRTLTGAQLLLPRASEVREDSRFSGPVDALALAAPGSPVDHLSQFNPALPGQLAGIGSGCLYLWWAGPGGAAFLRPSRKC